MTDFARTKSPNVARRPSSRVSGLPIVDQQRLDRILAEPSAYIDHPSFGSARAERELFGTKRDARDTRGAWCNAAPVPPVRQSRRSETLSADEEHDLFLKLNYARRRVSAVLDKCKNRRLSLKAAGELLLWGVRAEDCRNRIVQANMPLVLAMAKRARLGNVDFAELISEGNLALLRSVDKFDCARGFKFSTYACRAIIKSFSRVALRTSRYRGRFPTEFDPTLERSDYLEQTRAAEESDCVDELRDIMHQNLAALNDVEKTVIKERFALDAPPNADIPPAPKTLEEVGVLIGVTKERVRQIQNRALQKLRVALENEFLAA